MKPIKFKEAQIELKKPNSMTDEECGSLWVYRSEEGECISLWKASLWTRIKFLFHGHVWLSVRSGVTQPPVWVDASRTVFVKNQS